MDTEGGDTVSECGDEVEVDLRAPRALESARAEAGRARSSESWSVAVEGRKGTPAEGPPASTSGTDSAALAASGEGDAPAVRAGKSPLRMGLLTSVLSPGKKGRRRVKDSDSNMGGLYLPPPLASTSTTPTPTPLATPVTPAASQPIPPLSPSTTRSSGASAGNNPRQRHPGANLLEFAASMVGIRGNNPPAGGSIRGAGGVQIVPGSRGGAGGGIGGGMAGRFDYSAGRFDSSAGMVDAEGALAEAVEIALGRGRGAGERRGGYGASTAARVTGITGAEGSDRGMDIRHARQAMILANTFFKTSDGAGANASEIGTSSGAAVGCRPERKYLLRELRDHELWKHPRFWDEALMLGVKEQLQEGAASVRKGWDDLQGEARRDAVARTHNVVFSQLASIAFNMLECGVDSARVRADVTRKCRETQLGEAQVQELLRDLDRRIRRSDEDPRGLDRRASWLAIVDGDSTTLTPSCMATPAQPAGVGETSSIATSAKPAAATARPPSSTRSPDALVSSSASMATTPSRAMGAAERAGLLGRPQSPEMAFVREASRSGRQRARVVPSHATPVNESGELPLSERRRQGDGGDMTADDEYAML